MTDFLYLQQKRKQLGMKVAEVCEKAQVTRAYYNQLVGGKIQIRVPKNKCHSSRFANH